MKNEKASNKALKHIVCCIILIIIFVMTITRVQAKDESTIANSETESVVPLKPQYNGSLLEINIYNRNDNSIIGYEMPKEIIKDINYYLNEYEETINFFATTFGYDVETIKNDLIDRNLDTEINENNIGNIKDQDGNIIIYPNPEYGIVEYFFDIMDNNRLERTKKLMSYEGESDYVEKLIIYYSNIYSNVDTSIALSIGAAESGYYKVKYMLRMNNIYGGMGYNGLIKHENIELGVLNYIRMLSLKYFGKGLISIYDIGYVYCPTVNDYGQKITSPHWINLVNKAKEKYDNYSYDTTIYDLINY